ncbi:hypothetical protein GCM10009754_14680 [Amycolatopsis minnesotensis]|uniref:Uncharacterized protein n=1 Tax=Amycolatopsis minnesotensis TaxID=337894 RepID=A0ABN2Q9Y8_9PSEU
MGESDAAIWPLRGGWGGSVDALKGALGEWDAVKGAFGACAGGGPYRAGLVGIRGAVVAFVAVMVVIGGHTTTSAAKGAAGLDSPKGALGESDAAIWPLAVDGVAALMPGR